MHCPISVCCFSTTFLSCSTFHFPQVASCSLRRAVVPLWMASSLWCGMRAFSSFPALLSPSSSSSPPLVGNGVPRIPRILFFGGDLISVTVLHALCTRLSAIYAAQQHAEAECLHGVSPTPLQERIPLATPPEVLFPPPHLSSSSTTALDAFLARHITVITPSLPPSLCGMPLENVCHTFSRQYPVLRYAIRRGLPVVPLDHPQSFAKSTLLRELLLPALPSRWRRPEASSSSTSSSGLSLSEQFDVCVVVSFRYFLPRRLLQALPAPVLNVHPSLLPRYRGASPIFSTLLHRHREEEEEERNTPVSPDVTPLLDPHDDHLHENDGHESGGPSTHRRPANGRSGGGVTILELSADQPVMDGGRIVWQRRVPLEKQRTDLRTYFPLVAQLGAAGCCELIFGGVQSEHKSEPGRTVANGRMDSDGKEKVGPTEATDAGLSFAWSSSADPTTSPTATAVPSATPLPCRARVPDDTDAALHRPASGSSSSTLPTTITDAVIQQAFSYYVDLLACHTSMTSHVHTWVQEVHTALHHIHSPSPSPLVHRSNALQTGPFRSSPESRSPSPSCPRGIAGAPHALLGRKKEVQKVLMDTHTHATPVHLWHPSWSWFALYPQALGSSQCDWPQSLNAAMAAATPQEYPTYAHYTKDPFHAPILPKDAALLRWEAVSGKEAFSVWSAFVGGAGMFSTVQTVLQKSCCPHGEVAYIRRARRLWRERQKKSKKKISSTPPQHGPPVSWKEEGTGGSKNASPVSSMTIPHPERSEGKENVGRRHATGGAAVEVYFMRSPWAAADPTPDFLAIPACRSSDLPPSLPARPAVPFRSTFSVLPTHSASVVDVSTLLEDVWQEEGSAAGGLFSTCSFTEAVHPDVVSSEVQNELAWVEEVARNAGANPPHTVVTSFTTSSSCSCVWTCHPGKRSGAAAPLSSSAPTTEGEDGGAFTASAPPFPPVSFYFGGWHGSVGGKTRKGRVLPLHPLPMLQKEHARMTTMRHWWEESLQKTTATTSTTHTQRPRKKEWSTPPPAAESTAREHTQIEKGTVVPIPQGSDDAYAYLPCTVQRWQRRVRDEQDEGQQRREEGMTASCTAWLVPGSAYFPRADASLGAIKCREGWFFWRAAHFSGAPTSAQPAHLLRKGLAMRCGTVYTNVFSCGSHSVGSSSLSSLT